MGPSSGSAPPENTLFVANSVFRFVKSFYSLLLLPPPHTPPALILCSTALETTQVLSQQGLRCDSIWVAAVMAKICNIQNTSAWFLLCGVVHGYSTEFCYTSKEQLMLLLCRAFIFSLYSQFLLSVTAAAPLIRNRSSRTTKVRFCTNTAAWLFQLRISGTVTGEWC